MEASLLAALASPPSQVCSSTSRKSPWFSSKKSRKENTYTRPASTGDAAPSYSVGGNPRAPGRMENLRVLIEEAKIAAAEGRLSAALRKYETAMVTLPEAYKPRLRRKIARLEAQLDDEEERSPGTPARHSRAMRDLAGEGGEKCPGPLDLLHIAVQDVVAAPETHCRHTTPSTLSTLSSRRSSPLVRGLATCGRYHTTLSDVGTATMQEHASATQDEDDEEEDQDEEEEEEDEDEDNNEDTDESEDEVGALGEALSSRLAMATWQQDQSAVARSIPAGRYPADCTGAYPGGYSTGYADSGKQHWQYGMSTPGGRPGEGDLDDAGLMDNEERRRAMNKEVSDTLERQVVETMNQASYEELINLHGIGLRRAQLIIQTRASTPFRSLADLSRIGMHPKQIEKMGKHNMLECLDVYHG